MPGSLSLARAGGFSGAWAVAVVVLERPACSAWGCSGCGGASFGADRNAWVASVLVGPRCCVLLRSGSCALRRSGCCALLGWRWYGLRRVRCCALLRLRDCSLWRTGCAALFGMHHCAVLRLRDCVLLRPRHCTVLR